MVFVFGWIETPPFLVTIVLYPLYSGHTSLLVTSLKKAMSSSFVVFLWIDGRQH